MGGAWDAGGASVGVPATPSMSKTFWLQLMIDWSLSCGALLASIPIKSVANHKEYVPFHIRVWQRGRGGGGGGGGGRGTGDGLLEDVADFGVELVDAAVEERRRDPAEAADALLDGQVALLVVAVGRSEEFAVEDARQVALALVHQLLRRATVQF